MKLSFKQSLLGLVLVPVVFLAGCASSPGLEMKDVPTATHPFDAQLAAVKGAGYHDGEQISGIHKMSTLRANQVGPELQKALENALKKANLFDDKSSLPVVVRAEVLAAQVPAFSVKFPTTTEVQYEIRNRDTDQLMYQQTVRVMETSDISAFSGASRALAAFDASLRKNMKAFIEALIALSEQQRLPENVK